MARYLLTPVFWRSGEGRMVRVYELVDRWEVCHTVVFGYHPSGSRQALGAGLDADEVERRVRVVLGVVGTDPESYRDDLSVAVTGAGEFL